MHKFVLPIVIEKGEDGYFVFCPQLQGCYTQGGTYEEAIANIEDAIRLHLEDRITLDNGSLIQLAAIEPEDLADELLENDPRFEQLIAARRERYHKVGGVSFATVRQTLIEELSQDLTHPDPEVWLF